MQKSRRTPQRSAEPAAISANLPPDLQPWGNAAALQSREDAPTSYPDDIVEQRTPEDDEVLFAWDPNKWLLDKAVVTVFEKILPKSAGIVADAPLELGDDTGPERAVWEAFERGMADDEQEAQETLRTQRLAEQSDWNTR